MYFRSSRFMVGYFHCILHKTNDLTVYVIRNCMSHTLKKEYGDFLSLPSHMFFISISFNNLLICFNITINKNKLYNYSIYLLINSLTIYASMNVKATKFNSCKDIQIRLRLLITLKKYIKNVQLLIFWLIFEYIKKYIQCLC